MGCVSRSEGRATVPDLCDAIGGWETMIDVLRTEIRLAVERGFDVPNAVPC